jgi:hypothetical protein
MGLLFFIGINWLLIAAVVGLIRKPAELKAIARSRISRPIQNAFLLIWISSILVAGWGVLSGGRLSWPVSTPWGELESWQLGGLLSFAGLGILFAASAYDNHLHRKRYEQSTNIKK